MIEIDGSHGEGGGQILRGATALSALTGIPVRIFNVRAGRPNPGLQPQHLMSLKAAAEVTGATVEGLVIGSTEIMFSPARISGGDFEFGMKTAGSITLVMQTLLPILSLGRCPSRVKINGGTDVPWSPPFDYMGQVMLPNLRAFGINARLELSTRGHYPKGGGSATLTVKNMRSVASVKCTKRGQVETVRGVSHCTNLPSHVARRQAESARRVLQEGGLSSVAISEEVSQNEGGGPGSGLVLWAEAGVPLRIGADALGAKGKRAEDVGREAAEGLLRELRSGMAIDRRMCDMVIIYMASAAGTSEIGASSITLHAETMMWLTEAFLGAEWHVSRDEGGSVISVDGAALGQNSEKGA